MNGGTQNQKPLGYTIVEVMIVLAVSGLMFLVAAVFISGKQAKTSFAEGANELTSQIQSVITQVNNGQYTDVPFLCNVTAGALTYPSSGTPSSDCVFLGKFIRFGVNSDPSTYEVYTLAGDRQLSDLSTAKITPVNDPNINLTKQVTTPQSLQVTSVKVSVGGVAISNPQYGVGFLQINGQNSGMYYAPALTQYDPNAATRLTQAVANPNPLVAIDSATICVTDGSQYGQIQIGGNGTSELSVNLASISTTPC